MCVAPGLLFLCLYALAFHTGPSLSSWFVDFSGAKAIHILPTKTASGSLVVYTGLGTSCGQRCSSAQRIYRYYAVCMARSQTRGAEAGTAQVGGRDFEFN